ncbi:MAG TPA: PEP-CTERM sorting domain-containing protein [Terriglobales bacterium]|nr:PEP-CTERM sorting domain-containing protein [Terriglobales bacterium]
MTNRFAKFACTLAVLGALAVSPRLQASPLALGTFNYIYSAGNVGFPGFGINNLTGAAASCTGPVTGPGTGCYPVIDELTFSNVQLTVNYDVNGSAATPLVVNVPNSDSSLFSPSASANCGTFGVDAGCGDPNHQWLVPGLEEQFGGNVLVVSATVTGNFTPVNFHLTDASLYLSTGSFTATLNPSTDCQGDCVFDTADLVTDLAGTNNNGGNSGGGNTVPEPATWALALGGLGLLGVARKRIAGQEK